MEPLVKVIIILVSLVGGGIVTANFIKNNNPMEPLVKLIIVVVSLLCGCLAGIVGFVIFVTITYVIGFYHNTPGIDTAELIHFILGLVIGLLIIFFQQDAYFDGYIRNK